MDYILKGSLSYETGSCCDIHRINIHEIIEGGSLEEAIERARKIVEEYHNKYHRKSEFWMSATLGEFIPRWNMHYTPAQEAVPAQPKIVIPATTAIPASPGKFDETRY